MKTTIAICALFFLLGCAQPPVDPELTFTEAFELPRTDATIILSGGTLDEPWIVFKSKERVVLKTGENYHLFNPQPAYDFFAEKIPKENLGTVEDFVCLARQKTSDASESGAYLLFIPGSGLYHFRNW